MIDAKNIVKYFDDLHVLDNISFNIEKNSFVSIVGPSGCGKTTLLRIIGGLINPTNGRIEIEEKSLRESLRQRKIGFCFQNPILLPWRNAQKNIELPGEIAKRSSASESSQKLLKLVKLQEFAKFLPSQLSGGMQQRVALARALFFEPPILLMDEPFGSLDEITRERMNLELLKIWSEKQNAISTIVFVTHSIPEAVFLSDKVVVLSKRPAKIETIIDIDLPRPRENNIRYDNKFINLLECIRKILKI